MSTAPDASLLDVCDLSVTYRARRRSAASIRAVDGVDLAVGPGETVGLVGESGSGKSTLGKAILGLAAASQGSIRFAGEDITHATRARRRALSRDLQVVFQDPYGSLNPGRTIEQTLVEPLTAHRSVSRAEAGHAVADMLARVGLAGDAASRFPDEFSGGQRQRIGIARALMVKPRLIVCDEPVSALDLSIQAQIMNLLKAVQAELGLSYLFIAHNLAVVRQMSHWIVVIYQGRVMESGPADLVYRTPAHPYTRSLLDAAPVADPREQAARRRSRARLGDRPIQAGGADGCPFAGRCPHVAPECTTSRPPLVPTPSGTAAACLRIGAF